jgi:hypothetical protein
MQLRSRHLFACVLAIAGWLACTAAFAQDGDATAWNPRSGDAWIDRQLADMNTYASRYRGAFIDEIVRYHAAPRELVTTLVVDRHWMPGDVYYACAVAQTIGRPCRAVTDAWAQASADGWSAVAKRMGLPDDAETQARLKQAITDSYAHWARPLAEVPVPVEPAPAAHAKKAPPAKAKARPAKPRPKR